MLHVMQFALELCLLFFWHLGFMSSTLHGFAFWFDAEFNGPVLAPEPISWAPPTSSADNHPEEEDDSKRRREPNGQTLKYHSCPLLLETLQLIGTRWSLLPEKDCLQVELQSHLCKQLLSNCDIRETSKSLFTRLLWRN
ncbi:hypothetical protein RIF29_17477 [Crotalaria pallida]|uniref:Uncharacterized protein n=1 Tax=Crotalaria pallida TaxID=3830 RepID=A0AAN9ID03_CROPI